MSTPVYEICIGGQVTITLSTGLEVYGTYLGRIGGRLVLATDTPDGRLIQFVLEQDAIVVAQVQET